MRCKLYLLILSLLFAGSMTDAFAQQPNPSLMNDKEYARYCIENLKSGVLIVRLNFKMLAVKAFEKSGNTAAANSIRLEQQQENIEIVKAFRDYFKFCPVYFISFDSTPAALKGKHSGYFLSDDLKADPSISINKSFFLFADHGMLETSLPRNKADSLQESVRRGTMANALVIRDNKMKVLKSPFPYYVHFGDWDERVKKLEKRLQRFFQRNK